MPFFHFFWSDSSRKLATRAVVLLLCALVTTSWAQYPPPVLQHPSEQQGLTLTIENQTGYPIDVLYVQGGQYVKYTTIPIGRDMTQPQVTPGLTWHFGIESRQAIIGQYVTTSNPDQLVVLDAGVLAAAGVPPAQQQVQGGGSALPQPLPPPTFSEKVDVPVDIPEKVTFDPSTVTTPAVPPGMRGPRVDWYLMPGDNVFLLTNGRNPQHILQTDEKGLLTWQPLKRGVVSQTDAAFLLHDVDGKEGVVRIQNAYYLDSYLYIDQDAREGSPVRSGPEGATSPGGEWIVSREGKRQYYHVIKSAAYPHLRIAIRGRDVGLSSVDFFAQDPNPTVAEAKEFMNGDSFILFDAKSMRELKELAPALTQMAANFERLEQQQKAREAEVKRQQEAAEAAERERRAIARVPKVASGGVGTTSIGMRLGVGDVYDTETGAKAIRYVFSPPGPPPYLEAVVGADAGTDSQSVRINLVPEVAAWVEPDGTLFVGVDTGKDTSINMFRGDQPSSEFATDANWYLGNVRMSLQFQEGREVIWYPTVENRRVSFGVSSDVSKGINVSAEEILGADISESVGQNVNWDTREFEVSGKRGPGIPQMGSMLYEWDSCALADKVKSTEPCTYSTPVDFYDPATLTLRKIPLSAHSLQGLETRTVFKSYFPRQGISDRLQLTLDIDVQAHMVKVVKTNKSNTKNKDWEDFKAGFTYVFRPDLWDTDKSFEDQHIIKDALQKPVGFTQNLKFRYFLLIHIDDIREYIDVDRRSDLQTANAGQVR